jgi:hypothetical protein
VEQDLALVPIIQASRGADFDLWRGCPVIVLHGMRAAGERAALPVSAASSDQIARRAIA